MRYILGKVSRKITGEQGDIRGSFRQRNGSCVGNRIYLDAFTVELTVKIRNYGGHSGN